jgi:predicted nucleic acid-binding protein
VYLDTAYIAKCYLNEPDAAAVRALVAGRVGLTSSAWSVAEMACIFQRHVREGGLTRAQAASLRKLFIGDATGGVWTLVPVSRSLLDAVDERVSKLRKNVYLRAGDAVHLITAKEAGFHEVWTNDRHMLGAARHFGLVGRSA